MSNFPLSVPGHVRSQVRGRDQSRCVRCGMRGDNIHHRRLKNLRDEHTHCPCNLVVMCGSGTTGCHGWAHHNRFEAGALGIIVSRYKMPAAVPMDSTPFGLLLLDCEGGWEPVLLPSSQESSPVVALPPAETP